MFDETRRGGIGDGFSGVREMGNGRSGFTFAVVTKLVKSAIDDTIIKIAKSVVPIRLFREVEVEDLGIPKTRGSHDDMWKSAPFFIGKGYQLKVHKTSADVQGENVSIFLEALTTADAHGCIEFSTPAYAI